MNHMFYHVFFLSGACRTWGLRGGSVGVSEFNRPKIATRYSNQGKTSKSATKGASKPKQASLSACVILYIYRIHMHIWGSFHWDLGSQFCLFANQCIHTYSGHIHDCFEYVLLHYLLFLLQIRHNLSWYPAILPRILLTGSPTVRWDHPKSQKLNNLKSIEHLLDHVKTSRTIST